MNKPLLKNSRGFTLIELVVAITILGIIVAPLLHSFISSSNTAKKSSIYKNATDVAQNIIEIIEADGVHKFLIDNNAEIENGTFTVFKEGIVSGDSNFKAKIILTSINNTQVAFDNPMDAIVDMNSADDMALNQLYSNLADLKEITPEPAIENLTRTIIITATKDSAKNDTYSIEVSFTYTGSFTGLNKKHNLEHRNEPIVIKSHTSVNAKDFSLYLFFKAFYSGKDTIIINNPSYQHSNFRVFLVNTNDNNENPHYKANIRYFYQPDFNEPLVFTNLNAGSYNAFSTDTWCRPIPITGSLVEEKALDLLYTVTVEIYEQEKSFDVTPIAKLTTNKLN